MVERGKGIRILGAEHRLRRLQALAGIRRHQCQAAERRLDDPPQAVVEAHRRKVGGRVAGDGLTGRSIAQAVGWLANENPLALGAEQKPPLLQGGDDSRGARIAAGDDLVDALDGLVETVGAEAGQCILVWPGLRPRHWGTKHAKDDTPSTSTPSASTRAMKRSLKASILIVPAFVARRPNTSRLGRLDSCYQRNATVSLRIGRYDAPPHFLVTLL